MNLPKFQTPKAVEVVWILGVRIRPIILQSDQMHLIQTVVTKTRDKPFVASTDDRTPGERDLNIILFSVSLTRQ
jgi:hypothetical protein